MFLLNTKQLSLHPESPDTYFRKNTPDGELTAPQDAALVFYDVKETDGVITDIKFNFVARSEFLRIYSIVEE